MRNRTRNLGILAAVAAAGVGLGVVRAQQEPGKRIGERIDDAAQAVKRAGKDVGNAVKEQFSKVKTGVHDMGVTSRVYSRLHWDKDLNGSTIEVDVKDDGVAILKGSVPSAELKAKAAKLAAETLGVKSVDDMLGVAPSGSVDKVTTETKTTTTVRP